MDVEKYISDLKGRQAVLAMEALLRPKGRDGFAYGEASGRIQGMQDALDLLDEQLAAADGTARKKQPAPVRQSAMGALLESHPLLPEEQ